MRLLLDTHVFLWWLADSRKLPRVARQAIEAPANEILVSAVSIWEIAIKSGLGKLEMTSPERLAKLIEEAELRELVVTSRHAAQVRRLPLHHRDPFDRLLVAQAQVEEATLVTTDLALHPYEVPRLPA